MFNFAEWIKNDVLEGLIKKLLKEGLTFNIDTNFEIKNSKGETWLIVYVKGKVQIRKESKK